MIIKELINIALLVLVAMMICINYKLNKGGNKESRILSIVSLVLVLII
ncbi:hypothetical protein [uncultured Methanobrevibacter sp.]|nr:hypothetical protein [uncultured Methanobrevibacter sp.]